MPLTLGLLGAVLVIAAVCVARVAGPWARRLPANRRNAALVATVFVLGAATAGFGAALLLTAVGGLGQPG